MKKLLIANRGEIAIRVARTAAEMGLSTLAVFAEDDAAALHTRLADAAAPLSGSGPKAYLDGAQIIRIALDHGCDAVHPGYGFLSENAAFARACAEAGLSFVGPSPEALELFGDKVRALDLAEREGVPILAGTRAATSLEEAEAFLRDLGAGGAVMLKALAGGGGRGMRPVTDPADLASAFERCRSEAAAAFGNGDLYAEQFLRHARHVEVQILGDGTGEVIHLWDRECSIQRERQKLIEIAPALGAPQAVREQLFQAAVRLGAAVRYRGLGTIEFLVFDAAQGPAFIFMEANPRLQVEHTVTEAVTGLDLVRLQIEIAGGTRLANLGLTQAAVPPARGVAIQTRVNLETMTATGQAKPAGGVLSVYEAPSGPGVRVDGFGYAGYRTSARYDSLLAKVIVHAAGLEAAAAKAYRALGEFKILGAGTNITFLQAILADATFRAGGAHIQFVEEHIEALAGSAAGDHPRLHFVPTTERVIAGARLDTRDPLAVLAHGKSGAPDTQLQAAAPVPPAEALGPDDTTPVRAPLQGTVVSVGVAVGDPVRQGQAVAVMESMKMEHVIASPVSGHVREIAAMVGDAVFEGHALLFVEEGDVGGEGAAEAEAVDLDHIRPDLAEVLARQARVLDAARPEAVARRRRTGQRTARENVDDLIDPGSFLEYGALTVAARRRRHSLEELIAQTPADGIVLGLARINGQHFADDAARVAVMAYDFTVLAGTQGIYNHHKMDRLIEVAQKQRLPVVVFCEGGGGRPGDTDGGSYGHSFQLFAQLSGAAPLVGIVSGRCFAGNASLLGCCDVVISTRDATIGMGGPAMIEGGGLGVFRPEEVGPVSVQEPNGVIDVLVEDEAEAVAVARQYLSYFQGPLADWTCADQRRLRGAIPENRLRVYDIQALIGVLADEGSMLELRPMFGRTMVTALIRIEGRPIGVIANNPKFLGGAIDSDGSDKAARFMQICEAFDIPILTLVDTPGMMVGPEVEKTALVRHCSRLFLIGANLTVPMLTVCLRKSYGLGAVAMIGGSFRTTVFSVSWPTGEFGPMGLEGAVKLGFRNELAAIEDPVARKARFDEMVAAAYEDGKALNRATAFTIDDVIDPADTRRWIIAGLRSQPAPPPRTQKKLKWIDAW